MTRVFWPLVHKFKLLSLHFLLWVCLLNFVFLVPNHPCLYLDSTGFVWSRDVCFKETWNFVVATFCCRWWLNLSLCFMFYVFGCVALYFVLVFLFLLVVVLRLCFNYISIWWIFFFLKLLLFLTSQTLKLD